MIIHQYKDTTGCYVAAFPLQHIEQVNEIRKWCFKTYGAPGNIFDKPRVRWRDDVKMGQVNFDNERDLMMFVLRWE